MAMIRKAQAEDEEALLALAQEFSTSFEVEAASFHRSFTELLRSSSAHLVVAEEEETVVGYLLGFVHPTFYANGNVAWVEEIAVRPDYRRGKIGSQLMESMETWAGARECKLIALATRRAASFYAALGYEESATYFRKVLKD